MLGLGGPELLPKLLQHDRVVEPIHRSVVHPPRNRVARQKLPVIPIRGGQLAYAAVGAKTRPEPDEIVVEDLVGEDLAKTVAQLPVTGNEMAEN